MSIPGRIQTLMKLRETVRLQAEARALAQTQSGFQRTEDLANRLGELVHERTAIAAAAMQAQDLRVAKLMGLELSRQEGQARSQLAALDAQRARQQAELARLERRAGHLEDAAQAARRAHRAQADEAALERSIETARPARGGR